MKNKQTKLSKTLVCMFLCNTMMTTSTKPICFSGCGYFAVSYHSVLTPVKTWCIPAPVVVTWSVATTGCEFTPGQVQGSIFSADYLHTYNKFWYLITVLPPTDRIK